jgi:hypothetical protein
MNGETPLPICRVGELEASDDQPRWLVESLWSHQAVGFVAGQPKLGKTWLALDLALSVATGTPCLDTFAVPEPGRVLVYLAEDPPALVRERLVGLCQHRGLGLGDVPLHVITAPSLRLDLERDQLRLRQAVATIAPRLLVLDPLVRLHRRDENHSGEVAELLSFLRELQRVYDLAVVVVHHMRKGGHRDGGQALRGSGDFHAWTDSALYLRPGRETTQLTAEHRAAPAQEPIGVRLCSQPDGSRTRLVLEARPARPAPVAPPDPTLPERLIDLLGQAPRPLTRVELRTRMRVNNQRLGQALRELEEKRALRRTAQGWQLAQPGP